jgi:hypothetical protein
MSTASFTPYLIFFFYSVDLVDSETQEEAINFTLVLRFGYLPSILNAALVSSQKI